jgi:hypothetical protein
MGSFPLLLLMVACLTPFPVQAQMTADIETGIVFSGYNDVRIPGDGGTLFSLSEDLHIDPSTFFRVRAEYTLNSKHTIGLLVAPLRLEAKGSSIREIHFLDESFPPDTQLKARYRFDSYRLTYRYELFTDRPFQAGLGVTAKIRDAAIALEDGGKGAEKKNTGFVPLVHFRLHWFFLPRFGMLLSGDALAAPQGRAEDVLLAVFFRPNRRIGLKAGYRILEGGADNDEVYNFTLIHYLVAGALVSF